LVLGLVSPVRKRSTKSVGSDATMALNRMKTFKFLEHENEVF